MNTIKYKVLRFIYDNRLLGSNSWKLERKISFLDNVARFHKKYGKGDNCKIIDCECKK